MFHQKKYDLGIVSFNINTLFNNYGAALHSFAFQKYLNTLGINSVIVDYAFDSQFNMLWNIYKRKPLKYPLLVFNAVIKYFMVKNFFKKNCVVTKRKYYKKNIKDLDIAKRYCCETDVTWATFGDEYDRVFMCDLPSMKNKNNIAYSVDFGTVPVSNDNQIKMKTYAKNFNYISARNIFRLEEFKTITERNDICITIDPVFLINKQEWEKVTNKPKFKNDYVLVYNCKEDNNEMVNFAKEFANKNNLKFKLINCVDKFITNKNHYTPTLTSIGEFLGLIQGCKYFFTNSYHGICFAIIFEKEFFAFTRETNPQKILTVLKIFDLENRYVKEDHLDCTSIDYKKVRKLLEQKRTESQNWLKQALFNSKTEEIENECEN